MRTFKLIPKGQKGIKSVLGKVHLGPTVDGYTTVQDESGDYGTPVLNEVIKTAPLYRSSFDRYVLPRALQLAFSMLSKPVEVPANAIDKIASGVATGGLSANAIHPVMTTLDYIGKTLDPTRYASWIKGNGSPWSNTNHGAYDYESDPEEAAAQLTMWGLATTPFVGKLGLKGSNFIKKNVSFPKGGVYTTFMFPLDNGKMVNSGTERSELQNFNKQHVAFASPKFFRDETGKMRPLTPSEIINRLKALELKLSKSEIVNKLESSKPKYNRPTIILNLTDLYKEALERPQIVRAANNDPSIANILDLLKNNTAHFDFLFVDPLKLLKAEGYQSAKPGVQAVLEANSLGLTGDLLTGYRGSGALLLMEGKHEKSTKAFGNRKYMAENPENAALYAYTDRPLMLNKIKELYGTGSSEYNTVLDILGRMDDLESQYKFKSHGKPSNKERFGYISGSPAKGLRLITPMNSDNVVPNSVVKEYSDLSQRLSKLLTSKQVHDVGGVAPVVTSMPRTGLNILRQKPDGKWQLNNWLGGSLLQLEPIAGDEVFSIGNNPSKSIDYSTKGVIDLIHPGQSYSYGLLYPRYKNGGNI